MACKTGHIPSNMLPQKATFSKKKCVLPAFLFLTLLVLMLNTIAFH